MQQQQMISSVNTEPKPSLSGSIPPTIQWVVAPPQPSLNPKFTYPSRQSMQLGVTLIICGTLSIIFNIVDVVTAACLLYCDDNYYGYNSLGFVGHGFWSGLMCVVAGILGIVAGRKRTACKIRASMVLCILAACCALGQLAVSVIGVSFLGSFSTRSDECCSYNGCHYYNTYYDYYVDDNTSCRKVNTLIAMESLLAILSLVGGICAIVLSALACKAACCCSTQTVVYPGQPAAFLQNGVQVAITPQQLLGAQMAGYPFQYPIAAYGPPADYEYPTPPPGYNNPLESTNIKEDKLQLLL